MAQVPKLSDQPPDAVDYNKWSNAEVEKVKAYYEAGFKGIQAELAQVLAKQATGKPVGPATQLRLKSLLEHLNAEVAKMNKAIGKAVVDMIDQAATMSKAEVQDMAHSEASFAMFQSTGEASYLRDIALIKEVAASTINSYGHAMVSACEQHIKLGVVQRSPWQEIANKVRGEYGAAGEPWGNNMGKYGSTGAAAKAARLVRTELSRMRTITHKQYTDNDKDVIGIRVNFGGGACPGICQPKAGAYYYHDRTKKRGKGPDARVIMAKMPFHPNCRCFVNYIYRPLDWEGLEKQLSQGDAFGELQAMIQNVALSPGATFMSQAQLMDVHAKIKKAHGLGLITDAELNDLTGGWTSHAMKYQDLVADLPRATLQTHAYSALELNGATDQHTYLSMKGLKDLAMAVDPGALAAKVSAAKEALAWRDLLAKDVADLNKVVNGQLDTYKAVIDAAAQVQSVKAKLAQNEPLISKAAVADLDAKVPPFTKDNWVGSLTKAEKAKAVAEKLGGDPVALEAMSHLALGKALAGETKFLDSAMDLITVSAKVATFDPFKAAAELKGAGGDKLFSALGAAAELSMAMGTAQALLNSGTLTAQSHLILKGQIKTLAADFQKAVTAGVTAKDLMPVFLKASGLPSAAKSYTTKADIVAHYLAESKADQAKIVTKIKDLWEESKAKQAAKKAAKKAAGADAAAALIKAEADAAAKAQAQAKAEADAAAKAKAKADAKLMADWLKAGKAEAKAKAKAKGDATAAALAPQIEKMQAAAQVKKDAFLEAKIKDPDGTMAKAVTDFKLKIKTTTYGNALDAVKADVMLVAKTALKMTDAQAAAWFASVKAKPMQAGQNLEKVLAQVLANKKAALAAPAPEPAPAKAVGKSPAELAAWDEMAKVATNAAKLYDQGSVAIGDVNKYVGDAFMKAYALAHPGLSQTALKAAWGEMKIGLTPESFEGAALAFKAPGAEIPSVKNTVIGAVKAPKPAPAPVPTPEPKAAPVAAQAPVAPVLPDAYTSPVKAGLTGYHTKYYVTGPDGGKYLFKPPAAGESFLAYADAFAATIAAKVNPTVAVPAKVVTVGGLGLGSVQPWIEGLKGVNSLTKIPKPVLDQLMAEHVVDWFIGNHDTHGAQFFFKGTGKKATLVPIDKGNAGKFWFDGNEVLGKSFDPIAKGGSVYWKVYQAAKAKLIHPDPKATLDAIKRLEAMTAEEIVAAAQPYVEARAAQTGMDAAKAYKMLLKRQATVRHDFEVMLKDVYGPDFTFADIEARIVAATPAKAPVTKAAKKATQNKKIVVEDVDAAIVAKIVESRSNGYTLRRDKGDIEDLQVLAWQEIGPAGEPIGKLHFKLNEKAGLRMEEIIKAKAKFVEAPKQATTGAKPLAGDVYWADILPAIKTVNYHNAKGDWEYSPSKLSQALTMKASLLSLLETGTAAHKKMAKAYLDILDTLAAHSVKDAPHPQIPQVNQYKEAVKPPTAAEKAVAAAKLQAEIEASGGFTVEIKQVRVDNKKLEKGYLKHTDGGDSELRYFEHMKEYVLTYPDGMKITYQPHGTFPETWTNAQFAMRGDTNLTMPKGKALTPAMIEEAFTRLGKLGVDMAKAHPDYVELLYLQKQAYYRNIDREPGYAQVWGDQTLDPGAKVKAIKEWLLAEHGIKTDGNPLYQPNGFGTALGNGPRNVGRFDLTPAQIKGLADKYVLVHHLHSGTVPEALDIILNSGGSLISTLDKARRGVGPKGMSPAQDLESGGAAYVFTRVRTRETCGKPGYQYDEPHLVFKATAALRLDSFPSLSDHYGDVGGRSGNLDVVRKHRQTLPTQWRTLANSQHNSNETTFKHALNLLDDVEAIFVGSATQRQEALDVFKKHGITHVTDGRSIEDVIMTKHEFMERPRSYDLDTKNPLKHLTK
ncbi:MAG: hypothetical protein KJ576_20990 [Proteobacteria bacterium]|nr:hypothetical protein [Pseudomonadota bacterium]